MLKKENTERLAELLESLLILELLKKQGVTRANIRKLVGCGTDRLSEVVKLSASSKRSKNKKSRKGNKKTKVNKK